MIPESQIDTPEKYAAWEQLFRRYHFERRWAIENTLKIRTKGQRLVLLKLNEAQERLYEIVERQEGAGVPVRVIGVKPRKVGLSTGIQALFFQRATSRPLQKGMTVAHDTDSTQEMFAMNDLFYTELPEQLKPMKRYGSTERLVFENPDDEGRKTKPGLRSQLTIGTAGKVDLGRSKDIHLLHCSESPYWPDAEKTELSLFNAVPNLPSTMIFKEGTPNGVGDKFHNDYEDAKAGRTAFSPYFMAWWEFLEYQLSLTVPREVFEDTIDDDERKIIKAYNLSLEQVNWRRWCIENNCGRDENKFLQEYPANDLECFLVSGRPRFNARLLHDMLLACIDPTAQGYLKWMVDAQGRKSQRVTMEKNDRGFVKIWSPPKMASRYVLAADVAEGLEHGDFSCGHVYEWDTNEQVAEWHGHIPPDLFADELGKLGKIYNNALIGVESNKDGGTVNTGLRNQGYPHLYYRQELENRTSRRTARLGWLTNTKTKPLMINSLEEAIHDGIKINSRETIQEMMTFVINPDATVSAQSGCHDDRVITSAIAQELRKAHSIGRIFPSVRRQ